MTTYSETAEMDQLQRDLSDMSANEMICRRAMADAERTFGHRMSPIYDMLRQQANEYAREVEHIQDAIREMDAGGNR